MQGNYYKIIRRYPKISLREERRLIAKAKRGSHESANEIVLRHMGFVSYRFYKKAFPPLRKLYGQDIISDCIPLLYKQIELYNLRYYDRQGNFKPVRFVSYIWKGVDGFIITALKKEAKRMKMEKD